MALSASLFYLDEEMAAMTTDQITTWADETRAAATRLDNLWDWRAIDWPLNGGSVVVEVGGYKGRWALQIAERYSPRLYVFEPQPWAFAACQRVLGDRAKVLPYGLGATSGMLAMGDWETDGCSFVKPGGQTTGSGMLREIGGAFRELGITTIDLMLVNIEGYEYTLLPHMFDRGICPARLMVQFHDFADPSGDGMRAIQARMAGVYRLAWDYAVLTAWERV